MLWLFISPNNRSIDYVSKMVSALASLRTDAEALNLYDSPTDEGRHAEVKMRIKTFQGSQSTKKHKYAVFLYAVAPSLSKSKLK